MIARDVRTGRMEAFHAKNVILACGGAGQAYKPTTNGLIVTGDGIALAYRAGAPLMDMEMVQYHPTCLVETGILITEGARGEGAHLLNSNGERFMEKSAPNKMELASRDVVSRAEQIEINEGRGVGPGGAGIFLDVTVVPRKRTLEALREIVNLGRDFAGVDITREPIMIRPGQHYIMGGVKTDVDGRTPIEGLYAAGEVACVSVHGGNRLGANSLLDTLIFGRRAGEHAAARAAAMGHAQARRERPPAERRRAELEAIIARPREGRRVSEIKNELGETMNKHAAVFRDEAGPAESARDRAPPAKRRPQSAWIDDRGTVFNQDVLGAIELGYMIDCAEATVRRRDRAQGVPRRPVPHRLPRAQRRGVAEAHRHHAGRRRAEGQLLAGDDHPVAARGEEILMPEAHDRPPEQFKLRLRRYDPESGEAPYWDEHTVELEPHRSVLEAILQARDRFDGSIGIRCSCRQAICGSCGVRVNGEPALACHTHLDAALSERSATGVIEIEPMGNMPVIKDLIVDMDAVHWKKIQRVTPWLLAKQPVPEREYIVPKEAMVDVTQTMACIQCGACVSDCLAMEVDPGFIGPAALAKAYRFVGDPRDDEQHERLDDLAQDPQGIFDCTHCFKCVEACPKDVNPMGQIMRLRRIASSDQHIVDQQQRRAPRGGVHDADQGQRPAVGGRAAAALLRRQLVVRQIPPRRGQRAGELAARDPEGAAARQGDAGGRAETAQDPARRTSSACRRSTTGREPRGALRAEPVHHRRGRSRGR